MEWHIGRFKVRDREGSEYSVDAYKRVAFPAEVLAAKTQVVIQLRLEGRRLNYLGRGMYVHIDDWGRRIVLESDDPAAP